MRFWLLISALLVATPASAWRPASPGIRVQALPDEAGHVFELDLTKVRLEAAKAPKDRGATAKELAAGRSALLAVNGGYFDPKMRSLGLLVSNGKQLNPLRRADWGVMTVNLQGRARLTHTRDHKRTKATEFAIQAGPRLLVAGKPTSLKPQWARRTALGILKANPYKLLLIVTKRSVSLMQLAEMFQTLGCDYALNLDGGSSTQLWADKSVSNVAPVDGVRVANALLVTAR
ncbi:MAG: exopolysaccharide biosynthesis protein [Myxococcota bacterium]|jgi:exopolysaccharide biosynthesis protein